MLRSMFMCTRAFCSTVLNLLQK